MQLNFKKDLMFNKTVSKIILLGDSAVGKTSLLNSYVDKKFLNSYKTTIGADFMEKEVVADGKVINLQIWDTAGQEKFRSLGSAFYRGAQCCVLVYDITKKSSFESVESWISQFLIQGSPKDPEDFPFVLIGNKIDKQAEREVEEKLVQDFLQRHPKIIHLLTSAKLSEGVEIAFQKIALRSVENISQQIYGVGLVDKKTIDKLNRERAKNRKTWC